MEGAKILDFPNKPKDVVRTTQHGETVYNTEYGRVGERTPGRFQIQFTDANGRRHTKTFGTLKLAEKELKAQAGLKAKGITDHGDTDRRVKVSALADSYKLYAKNSKPKSAAWIEIVWRAHLDPFFGHLNAGRVDTDKIEEYRAARREAGAATSTINREVAVLHATFNHGLNSGKLARLPRFPKNLAEPNARHGFLSFEQYTALVKACPRPWLRALMAVAYNFGFRKAELLGLRVGQIDLKARTIQLRPGETKSGRGRTVVMTDDVFPLIAACIEGKPATDSVFTFENGKPVRNLRRPWEAMCKAAGISILLHDFRRTAVRNLIRAGVSRDVAKRISGHETDSIFSRYNITDQSDVAEASRKLDSARAKSA